MLKKLCVHHWNICGYFVTYPPLITALMLHKYWFAAVITSTVFIYTSLNILSSGVLEIFGGIEIISIRKIHAKYL